MISLPSARFLRLLAGASVIICIFFLLNISLYDKGPLNALVNNPLSPYSRADLAFAKKAGLSLVPIDNAANVSDPTLTRPRVRAAILMLARNTDLVGAKSSISQLEKRFNHKYHYPYIYLNDKPFSEQFKTEMSALTPHSTVSFGLIPTEHWSYPDWINQTRAAEVRADMGARKIIYGDSLSYRHMCRFNSGFFFRHPLLDDYDYYWRVEPYVDFFCDIPNDPFRYLQENNKLYGFTISLYEFYDTVPTLWDTVNDFIRTYPDYVRPENAMRWLGDDSIWNLCHFWSNFEIASLHLWRSQAYLDFFEYLDRAGGFFYERWGDAPVHSIAAAMVLKPSQIHFFNEIGYHHAPFKHCPVDQPGMRDRCQCNGGENFDRQGYSCTGRWLDLFGDAETKEP